MVNRETGTDERGPCLKELEGEYNNAMIELEEAGDGDEAEMMCSEIMEKIIKKLV